MKSPMFMQGSETFRDRIEGSGAGNTGQAQTLLEVAPVTPHSEEYRTIPLTRGEFAIVDAGDYEWLSQWRWRISTPTRRCTPYALAAVRVAPYKQITLRMHRLLMGLEQHDPRLVDHINGNGLDNRRANLRIASPAENAKNCRLSSRNTSGFKGVSWSPRQKRYRAAIYVRGRNKHLGYFLTAADGHEAYKSAARSFYGEFARFA